MARPRKIGLDYFPFDVDFFENEKVVCIAGEFGIKGEMVAIKLLCAIYRNGYFIEWNDALRFKMLHKMPGVSAELFDQILNRLVRWGFFDASLFDSVKVLTSEDIQRRYFEIIRKRIPQGEYPYKLVSAPKTPVSAPEMQESKLNKKKKSPNGDKKVDDFDDVVANFFSEANRYSLEVFCMSNYTDEATVRTFANEVIAEWRLQGLGTHADAQAHLLNCIRIKLEYKRKNERKLNETDQTDKFQRRRGTEPTATSRKDFDGTL